MIPVPKGFKFAAAKAGFRKPDRLDLGLIVSETPAAAAGVFTKNLFQAAPVLVAGERLLKSPYARAFVINSGQANACTGDEGLVTCRAALDMTGKALSLDPSSILPASTGVIGDALPLDKWEAALPELLSSLSQAGPQDVAKAVMTTDTVPKCVFRAASGYESEVRVLGMAKGSGMICPNMATMLGFVICDAGVEPDVWQEILSRAVEMSFNRITVDGDTSTNDCVLALANGASGVDVKGDLGPLAEAVTKVCQDLSYMIIQDAEGGTKVIRIEVQGAGDQAQAELAARAVGNSPLVKTAMYGRDPNWGRIAAALGRSGASFDPANVRIAIAGIVIFENGKPLGLDVDAVLAPRLNEPDILVEISLGPGPGTYVLLASDLTHEYVSINAEYRT
ncbi:MAG: bifunctional glutamate N-acetyltransferase/amino-acid acetyltransferase ArgJ [Thermodesulfobacteriota bacterium]|nr:bifunctional glutamate N-acetyltransferase/amino-acid acetyltransferase ArgJ [Thermodesulfobacteriota bacterium]